MRARTVPEWRLVDARGPGSDAVAAALAREAATLSCGPHRFDFAKTHTLLGDVQLRLRHRADCACECDARLRRRNVLEVRTIERLIPAVTGDIDEATRSRLEEARLSTFGRALFAHVAYLISVAEAEPCGRRALRFSAVLSTSSRRPEVHRRGRVCAARGCRTLLSAYNPSLSCALHLAGGAPRKGATPVE